jgi:hypothetical protein
MFKTSLTDWRSLYSRKVRPKTQSLIGQLVINKNKKASFDNPEIMPRHWASKLSEKSKTSYPFTNMKKNVELSEEMMPKKKMTQTALNFY